MTPVAVVDLGTNSTRLLIARVCDGRVEELDRRLAITRLGERVDEERALLPDAIERVEAALVEYVEAANVAGVERRLAFATSAVRDATNGAGFLRGISSRFRLPTRLLSGDDEALLTFRGVRTGRPLAGPTLVVDLGGGSTELVFGGERGVQYHTSLDMGCVRLTERFFRHDPATPGEIAELRASVRALLAASVPATIAPEHGIGVAGTVTTLATLDLGLDNEDPLLVDGHLLSRDRIVEEAERLAATPVSVLLARPGIHPGRAPVIAAGALAIAAIVDHFGLDDLLVSEADILHGAALALAE